MSKNSFYGKNTMKMMQRIDLYIRGRLSQQEIDELWIEFLKEPEWYKIFETDLHLRAIAKNNYAKQNG